MYHRSDCQDICSFGVQGQRPAGVSKGVDPFGAARTGHPQRGLPPAPGSRNAVKPTRAHSRSIMRDAPGVSAPSSPLL